MPPTDDSTPSVVSLPVADVRLNTEGQAVTTRTFPVKTPESERVDFFVEVRASTLNKCRRRMTEVSRARFPWPELLLAFSSLAAGASLGALTSDLKPGETHYSLFFTWLPVAAAATFVGFLALRNRGKADSAAHAREALEELPDPERAR